MAFIPRVTLPGVYTPEVHHPFRPDYQVKILDGNILEEKILVNNGTPSYAEAKFKIRIEAESITCVFFEIGQKGSQSGESYAPPCFPHNSQQPSSHPIINLPELHLVRLRLRNTVHKKEQDNSKISRITMVNTTNIEIKDAPPKLTKSIFIHNTSEDEGMIPYDAKESMLP
ncbi:hypothetical protein TNCV_46761 [Trichonephila clavipes]|nr:hypothetical protein TNCV_46761 [Trichonephila clavipes]